MALVEPVGTHFSDAREYTILIVDDDSVDRNLCRRFLSKEKSFLYRVVEASDGAEARLRIAQEQPDCVLIDRFLGNEDGCELMAQLHESYPYLPAVILTGEGSGMTALRALRNGAVDYLIKSNLSTASLHRCIRNAIEKSDLSLDLDKQRRELNFSYGLLCQQHEILSHYYHTVTHELKNPLASCKEFLNILQDGLGGPVTPEQNELLSIAAGNCERMAEFLDDLFESSGIDTDKIRLDLKPCPLQPLVRFAVDDYLNSNRMKALAVELDIDEAGDSLVLVDQARIRRAFTKMLVAAENNIIHDEPIKVKILEDTDVCGSNVVIHYDGINNTDNRLVQFSTQHRLKTSLSNPTDDNVMGLDILFCKKVIELHEGSFGFERDENLGGTFTTKLPRLN